MCSIIDPLWFLLRQRGILFLNTSTNFTDPNQIDKSWHLRIYIFLIPTERRITGNEENRKISVQPESRWFICLPTGAALKPRNRAEILADGPRKRGERGKRALLFRRGQLSWRFGKFSMNRTSPISPRIPRWRFDIAVHFFAVESPSGMLERCKITGYRITERGISF